MLEPLVIKLSDREREVLQVAFDCLGDKKATAAKLCITERTVKAHLFHICEKFKANNLIRMFRMAKLLRYVS
jgi:DNA-binding NarL/FixJ family response regulator